MRIALGIEYNGGAYAGWQRQTSVPSVQAEVERALSRVADHPVEIVCAGRTDAGVHATHQVVHFDSDAPREMHSWVLGGTVNLPADIAVCWAQAVDDNFHARFKAELRAYRYVILNRRVRPGLLNQRVSWDFHTLDEERMVAAAAALVGEHDFTSYRAVACQARSPVRRIHKLDVTRSGEFIYIDVIANAFLHHMVRNIAGVLMQIGRGEHPVGWAAEVLAARDRTEGGTTAPAGGLYLVDVRYPQAFAIPAGPHWPRFS